MKHALTLPEGYGLIAHIDLQKNRKLMLWVNGMALVITLVLMIPVLFFIPFNTLWEKGETGKSLLILLLKLAVTLIAIVVYMILHELVHGVCMKAITKTKPHYGFTGMYAFAGSEAFFGKGAYILVALAPVILWGLVLAVLTPLVPRAWFWVVYFVQITNLSGAAGDLYVTCRMLRMPKDILVQDSGVAMKVYAKKS